jgi:hypothetical protein
MRGLLVDSNVLLDIFEFEIQIELSIDQADLSGSTIDQLYPL